MVTNTILSTDDRLLTGEEVADLLHISRSLTYQLMRRGDIPTVRIGRLVRVRRSDLQAYVDDHIQRADQGS